MAHMLPYLRIVSAVVFMAWPRIATATATLSAISKEIAPGVLMPFLNAGKSNRSVWVDAGGRGLDTAFSYGDDDQRETGAVARMGSVPRDHLFVTTKVPCCGKNSPRPYCQGHAPDTSSFLQHDLDVLGVDYVDVMLLHWPCDTLGDTLEAWRGIEDFYGANKARAIGVSNFNATLLDQFLPKVNVRPVVNQVGFSVGGHAAEETAHGSDDVTFAKCRKEGVTLTAYSPLGNITKIDVLKDPAVAAVADAHNRSSAQVALRWLVQQGIPLITATSSPSHAAADLDIFSFELTADEIVMLAAVQPEQQQVVHI
mmetsp:Transcript_42305/g.95204  ORF Transcript_42305/g.95204 Transcript_42305/m.95204 type:complete len:312 (-) Transcript_42305:10-945(-)